MKIERFPLGPLQANCYLVTKNNQTIIIDPGSEANKILELCSKKNIVGILVTHHHFDHIGALKELENHFKIVHNQKVPSFSYQTISNPGHSKDSISFYFEQEKVLFSGDFIFEHNIGRCDLEGGNWYEMQKSIQNILKYSDDITIYPGHGTQTTLKEERAYLQKYL
ncbi:MAG: MBL fold metallo-hydrolase [Bacilli bacterium]|jgi:hydroxyacylglutathione hydrolase|nr:MBL fold metallo-hydrolase [Bacilli bacterium]